jgi:hypothetical protein
VLHVFRIASGKNVGFVKRLFGSLFTGNAIRTINEQCLLSLQINVITHAVGFPENLQRRKTDLITFMLMF